MTPPIVSVILPVSNEARVIEQVIGSLLAQQTDGFTLELLVIDGLSTDGSREIANRIAAEDHRVRLLINEKRKTPFAFNLGLTKAQGEYVCILGAHCTYESNYIRICLQELLQHGAVGCSGRVLTRAANTTPQAQLVSWAMSHPFGVSGQSFRTQQEGFVDTIPYPVFRKQALLDLGGYDEAMLRNQDNDMNYRLRQAGHKLYLTAKTSCVYHPRPTIRGLLDYALNNGSWCATSFRKRPKSLGMRHYIPFVFTVYCLVSLLLVIVGWVGQWWFAPLVLLPLGLHLFLGGLWGVQIAWQNRRWIALLMPIVFFVFHFAYGWGFLRELVLTRNL